MTVWTSNVTVLTNDYRKMENKKSMQSGIECDGVRWYQRKYKINFMTI